MAVTREDVRKIARLSHLCFTDEEEERLTGELNEILRYMAKLDEIDTSGVEPLYHVIDTGNVLRDDQVQVSLSQEEALANAPLARDGFVLVPRVIE